MVDSEKSHVAMLCCPACGEAYGVALDTYLRNSLPRSVVGRELCEKCRQLTPEYVWLLLAEAPSATVKGKKQGPRLLGQAWAVKREAIRRTMPDLPDSVSVLCITESDARALGLFDIEAETQDADEAIALVESRRRRELLDASSNSEGEENDDQFEEEGEGR